MLILFVGLAWLAVFFGAEANRVRVMSVLLVPEAILASWFGHYEQPVGLLDRWLIVLVAAILLLASHEIGIWLLRSLRLLTQLTPLEHGTLAIGAGLNVISLYALVVGLAGGLQLRWLIASPLVIAAVATIVRLVLVVVQRSQAASSIDADEKPSAGAERTMVRVILSIAAVLVVVTLLGAMLPPWDFDVLEYHLHVPKEWFRQGKIDFLPHNIYGNMPLGAEMSAVAAMSLMPGDQGWWWGALAGKLVMACYVPLSAALLFAAGQRWLSPAAGAWAALTYVSHPWTVHTAVSGLNEPAVAFFVLAAVYAACFAPRSWGSMLLAGFFAGAAAACKYPAVVYAVFPLLMLVLLRRDDVPEGTEQRLSPKERIVSGLRGLATSRAWRFGVLFLGGVALGCGPWYLKNAVLAENPVYPLAYNLFGGKTRTPEKNARWERAHQVPPDAAGNRYSPAQLQASLGSLLLTNRYASPLLLPLLLAAATLAIIARWKKDDSTAVRDEPRWYFGFALVAMFVVLTAVWWLVTHRIDRFWVPALPLASLIAGWALAILRARTPQWATSLPLGFGILFCLVAAASPLVGDNRWFVAPEALRESNLSVPHAWLNENTTPGRSVLLVGGATPFDLEPHAYYNTCFDDCLLAAWAFERSPAETHDELSRRGIEYVFVNWDEIARYRSPGNYGFDPRWSEALLEQLVESNVLIPVAVVSDDWSEMIPVQSLNSDEIGARNAIYRVNEIARP